MSKCVNCLKEINEKEAFCLTCHEEVLECAKKKIADLEAKLAEKDEQLEYFSKRDDEQEKQLEKQALFHRKSIKELQNQKAIEQLEKVKMYIDDNAYYIDEKEFGIEINEYIDNQIKQLTHQHEDKGE